MATGKGGMSNLTISRPVIECNQSHAGLVVADIPTAIEFYTTKLGFTLGFTWGDPPNFAAVNLDKTEMFLRKGTPEPRGCTVYFPIGDADALYEFHRAQGVEIAEPIADRAWGLRDYAIRDLHGYHLVFGHHIYNTGPKIKIERVDVPVRLEKRLAALLMDLAEHKHMSLSSTLEEILLHTNDGVTPHTSGTLRHIEELKKKHGIEYDTHASYNFEE